MKRFTSIALLFMASVVMVVGCSKPSTVNAPSAEKTSSQKSIGELITDASQKQEEFQGSLTKTEELLLKRTAERDSKRAEFMQIIRGRDKSAEEIVAEFSKEKSELESKPWFEKARSVWKDWKDIQRRVVVFTRQKERLDKAIVELNNLLSKLKRIEEDQEVYVQGVDPELDKLMATIDLSVEEADKAMVAKDDPTLDIVTEQDMTAFVKTKVSVIPGFELESIDKLPSFPDFESLVTAPDDAIQKSLYNGSKNQCAIAIREAKVAAEANLKKKHAEEAVEVWLTTLDELQNIVLSWEAGKTLTTQYITALEKCKNQTSLLLCRPYSKTLIDCIDTLENGEKPQWENVVEALEGIYRIYPEIRVISEKFQLKQKIIEEHLKVLVKQNDWDAKVIQQRLRQISGYTVVERKAGERMVKEVNGVGGTPSAKKTSPVTKTSSQSSTGELITDASQKQKVFQGSLTKMEELLLKRTAERDSKRAEFMQIIRGRDKLPEEIVAEFSKEKSELESKPWFGKARSVWEDLKDIQRDVVIFTRQKNRLNKTLVELNSLLNKLKRIQENKVVYKSGIDPELDKLMATIQISVEEMDKVTKDDPTLNIIIEQEMTAFVKTKVSTIPRFELESIDKLPSFPDFGSLVTIPNYATQKSLYNGRKNKCAKIIKEATSEAEKKLKEKHAEEAVEVWLTTLDNLQNIVVSWDAGKTLTTKYIIALKKCKIETLLQLCQPYFKTLDGCIATLENGDTPQWEIVIDALEGIYRIYPKIQEVSEEFQLKQNIIEEHLKVLVKQNDWDAKVIQQRLEQISGHIKAGERMVKTVKGVEFAFRWCPAGTFMMGSPTSEQGRDGDETQHLVTLTKGFWMLETEVTQEQWKAIMGTSIQDQAKKMLTDDTKYNVNSKTKTTRERYGFERNESPDNALCGDGDDYPMYYINWNECKEFCEKCQRLGISVCLPTEAQWEYACRAGTTTSLYNGEIVIKGEHNAPKLDTIAWYGGNSMQDFKLKSRWDSRLWSETQYPGGPCGNHPVAQKEANAWGLHDMIGNVMEWCADRYGDYPSGHAMDSVGYSYGFYRVNRGGSWGQSAQHHRSASRNAFLPENRECGLGFRVVLKSQFDEQVSSEAEPMPEPKTGESPLKVKAKTKKSVNRVRETRQDEKYL